MCHESHKSVVAVFGANDAVEGTAEYDLAMGVGVELAGLGYTVANGGYGGTMAASARGAKAAGGTTIGVVCSIWKSSPNVHIDRVVHTDSLSRRIDALIRLGSAGYVVLPGATGTLVELATVWEWTAKGLLDRRPIVCVGRFWQGLIETMAAARPSCGQLVTLAELPEDLRTIFPPGKDLKPAAGNVE